MLGFSVNPSSRKVMSVLQMLDKHIKWLEGNEGQAADVVRAWLGEAYLNIIDGRVEEFNLVEEFVAYATQCEVNVKMVKSKRESNFITEEEHEHGVPGIPEVYCSSDSDDFSDVEEKIDAKLLLDEINIWREKIFLEAGFDLTGAINDIYEGFNKRKAINRLQSVVRDYELEELLFPVIKNPDKFYALEELSLKIYGVSFIHELPSKKTRGKSKEAKKSNYLIVKEFSDESIDDMVG